jgi:methyl-accepting chemotaxis protein
LKELVAGPELRATLADSAAAAGSARQILERAEKPVNQLLADLPKTLEGVNRLVQRLDSASADLPDSSAQLKQTLQRLNRLIANQQYEIQTTVQNLRSISESFKEITDNSKKYPSQMLFGAPPPPSKVMGR